MSTKISFFPAVSCAFGFKKNLQFNFFCGKRAFDFTVPSFIYWNLLIQKAISESVGLTSATCRIQFLLPGWVPRSAYYIPVAHRESPRRWSSSASRFNSKPLRGGYWFYHFKFEFVCRFLKCYFWFTDKTCWNKTYRGRNLLTVPVHIFLDMDLHHVWPNRTYPRWCLHHPVQVHLYLYMNPNHGGLT